MARLRQAAIAIYPIVCNASYTLHIILCIVLYALYSMLLFLAYCSMHRLCAYFMVVRTKSTIPCRRKGIVVFLQEKEKKKISSSFS